MKDQYASNGDDPFIANQKLRNKLDFLQRQSLKRQSYLKDLQRNIKLCKQSMQSIIKKQQNNQIIEKLNEENSRLINNLRVEYQNICKLNTLYLMQCQLRIQEAKNYNERIAEFQENIQQLRRYLHDKEESFSYVVEKLKKYEEIMTTQELVLNEKFINYSGIIKQQMTFSQFLKYYVNDRDAWKQKALKLQENNMKLEILDKGVKNFQSFQEFRSFVDKLSEQNVKQVHNHLKLQGNNIQENSSNIETKTIKFQHPYSLKNHDNESFSQKNSENKKPQVIQPNVQLIRLLKRQKLSGKILQNALNQAIQKNIQLFEINQRLIISNCKLKDQIDLVIADMVVLCNRLKKYDQNYQTKLSGLRHRAKCDLQMPSYRQIIEKYKKNQLQQAHFILFSRMRQNVQQLSQFINLCPLQKMNHIKSYEQNTEMMGESKRIQMMLDIEKNQKEYEVTQI